MDTENSNEIEASDKVEDSTESASVQHFDIVVAGGGIAGLLTSLSMARQNPDLNVALVEKEPYLGGRLRSHSTIIEDEADERRRDVFGYGLNHVSKSVKDYWTEFFKSNPDLDQIPEVGSHINTTCGILSAGKVEQTPLDNLMSLEGFRALGGAAAGREWKGFVDHWDSDSTKNFGAVWKNGLKSAGAIVFKHYGRLFGISDIWHAPLSAIKERAAAYSSPRFSSNWQAMIQSSIEIMASRNLIILKDHQIFKATYENSDWRISTNQQNLATSTLVVCQSPWETLSWLDKKHLPRELLALTMKTTPVSAVVLSVITKQTLPENLNDVTIIPAEEVQIIRSTPNEICIQSTIGYESSLQSESVAKAVRRMKRALKKLKEVYPEMNVEHEHIILVPVAWAPSTQGDHMNLQTKLQPSVLNKSHLMFCGDAYGTHYDGDQNFIQSINSVLDQYQPQA